MDINVSSLTFLNNEESKAKAIATVVVNDEFALHGIKVIEGQKGLFVQMPQKRDMNGNYNDIIFPVTAEAREQINNAVMEKFKNPISYDDLQLIGNYETKCDTPMSERLTSWDEGSESFAERVTATLPELQAVLADAKQFAAQAKKASEDITAPEKEKKEVKSNIYASLHNVNNNNYLKAAGQIVIDQSIVITGVRVTQGTVKDKEGKPQTYNYVNMPSYQTSTGEYAQYAHPITRECYDKINSCVMAAYQNIGRYEYKGVKFAELGDKADIKSISALNNKFAEKLMAELDKQGIAYNAKIAETTTISVKAADKETLDNIQKELKATLNPPNQKHGSR